MMHVMIVVMYGVWNLGCTLLTPRGRSPSRLIEKKMRGWLMSITSKHARDARDCASRYQTGRPVQVDDRKRVGHRGVQKLGVLAKVDDRNDARSARAATATYSNVQTMSEAMMPIGRSRRGFLASSAVVETASNPM